MSEQPETTGLSRRELVGGAAAGAAAVAVPDAAAAARRRRARRKRRRSADVVVVGAGLAGLTAARELRRGGRSVIVMEARKRVGGRCFSRSLGVGAGDVANLGATFIGPTQNRMIALAKELGIGTFPTYNTGKNVFYLSGQKSQYGRYVDVISDKLTVRAKRVVVAVPPPIAGRIRYEPGLPALRDQLTQRLPLGSVTKTFAVYDTAFWREDGLTGQATSDTGPVKVTFDGSPRSGTPGVLLGFVDGEDARVLNAKPPAERAQLEMESYVRYFGPRARNAKQVFDYAWDNDTVARGAPICFAPPGVLDSFGVALKRPVGAIHWAGTETASEWTGYMDGAVQSGQRVAREILASL